MALIEDDGKLYYPRPSYPGSSPTPPAPPAPPPPPGVIGIGGGAGIPDYAALIRAHPAYQAWKTQATTNIGNAALQRGQGLRALAMRYGGLPTGFADKYGDLDPETLQQAAENPFSEKATLQKSYEQGIEAMHRALAARGMLQSGELGHGETQAEEARGKADYMMGQDFISAMQQALNQFTDYEGGILGQEADIIAGVSPEVVAANPPSPTAPQPATLVSRSIYEFGFPVYRTQDGASWRIDPTTGQPRPLTDDEIAGRRLPPNIPE